MFELKKPLLVIISGVAGSGKTQLGHSIAKKLKNSTYISKDLFQDSFTKEERSGELYESISIPAFNFLKSFAELQLTHGKTAIIDCPFSFNHQRKDERKNWVEHFHNIATKQKSHLIILRCVPPTDEEHKERLRKRGNAYDTWKLNNWEQFKFDEPARFPINKHQVHEIITNKPSEELSENILKKIINNKDLYTTDCEC